MAKINSRAKGKNGETELSKILNERFGEGKKVFTPTPQSGAWSGGQNREIRENMSWEQKITLVADIMSPPSYNYIIEHKFYKEFNFYDLFNPSSNLNSWIDQVSGDASFVNKKPMLIVKTNNKQRIVFIKDKPKTPNFTYYRNSEEWHCYWLADLLTLDNSFFYS